ncbi:MAG: sugar transferase [Burkholderiaceae bacterium]|nr:sugar transferase [Burkholderiaceae bacterium]
MGKRLFDVIVATTGLLLLAPLLLAAMLWVRIDSPGPVLFRQERVGRHGAIFRIHKLRTMRTNGAGSAITGHADIRITRPGRWLRHYRIDELPQLIDVIKGDMSLVGPRPELPRFVALYPPQLRTELLAVRPGLTDPASLEFADEHELLAGSADPDRSYAELILPRKLQCQAEYLRQANWRSDLMVLARTLRMLGAR